MQHEFVIKSIFLYVLVRVDFVEFFLTDFDWAEIL